MLHLDKIKPMFKKIFRSKPENSIIEEPNPIISAISNTTPSNHVQERIVEDNVKLPRSYIITTTTTTITRTISNSSTTRTQVEENLFKYYGDNSDLNNTIREEIYDNKPDIYNLNNFDCNKNFSPDIIYDDELNIYAFNRIDYAKEYLISLVFNNRLTSFKYLLSKSRNSAFYDFDLLAFICRFDRFMFIEPLMEFYEKTNLYPKNINTLVNGMPLIFYGIINDTLDIVKNLINIPGYDINNKDKNGLTASHIYILFGKAYMYKFLMNGKIDFSLKDINNRTALDLALYLNRYDAARFILRYSFNRQDLLKVNEYRKRIKDIEPRSNENITECYDSGHLDSHEISEEYLNYLKDLILNNDFEEMENILRTKNIRFAYNILVNYAIHLDNLLMTDMLLKLKNKPKINIKETSLKDKNILFRKVLSPYLICADNMSNVACKGDVDYLLKHFVINENIYTIASILTISGNLKGLKQIYDKFGHPDQLLGWVLLTSVEYGQTEILKYIIENDPEGIQTRYNQFGENALHIAASNGNLEMVKILIENGIGINTPTLINGYSALHLASMFNQPEIVKYLLHNLAIIYSTNNMDYIDMAIKMQNREIFKIK